MSRKIGIRRPRSSRARTTASTSAARRQWRPRSAPLRIVCAAAGASTTAVRKCSSCSMISATWRVLGADDENPEVARGGNGHVSLPAAAGSGTSAAGAEGQLFTALPHVHGDAEQQQQQAVQHGFGAASVDHEDREEEGDDFDRGHARHAVRRRARRSGRAATAQNAYGMTAVIVPGRRSARRSRRSPESPDGLHEHQRASRSAAEMTMPTAGTPRDDSRPKTRGKQAVVARPPSAPGPSAASSRSARRSTR